MSATDNEADDQGLGQGWPTINWLHHVKLSKQSAVPADGFGSAKANGVFRLAERCLSTMRDVLPLTSAVNAPLEFRDLSLTLAVLERKLYRYLAVFLQCSPSPAGSAQVGVRARNRSSSNLKTAVRVARADTSEFYPALLHGGVETLLYNMEIALESTQASLKVSPLFHASLGDAVSTAIRLSTLVLLLVPLLFRSRFWLRAVVATEILPRLRVGERIVLNFLVAWLGRRTGRQMGHRVRWSTGWGLRACIGAFVLQLFRRHSRFIRTRKIAKAHRRLLVLLRMWDVVMDSLQESAQRSRASAGLVTLIGRPSRRVDYVDANKPEGRQVLENAPVPTSRYLPGWDVGRMGIFRYMLDGVFAASGVAWQLSGQRPWLSFLLLSGTMPYFLTHPRRACLYACSARTATTVPYARFGCGFLNHWLVRKAFVAAMRMRVAKACKLRYAEQLPVLIFAQDDLPGDPQPSLCPSLPDRLKMQFSRTVSSPQQSEHEDVPLAWMCVGPPVILYLHGGGFCVSLLELDLSFVARAIRTTGENGHRGAVVVVPEYSLAPELPFPRALDEVEFTYRWILGGGLGFRPARVVLCGESAGGNLAAALCVRLANDEIAQSASHGIMDRVPAVIRPAGLVLGYPALNLALSPSPSRALHCADPMLALGIMRTCVAAYVPPGGDATSNAEISPCFASVEVLARLPPLAMMAGGMDPLLDDAVDFHCIMTQVHARAQALHRLGSGRPSPLPLPQLRVFRPLPHGFWSLSHMLPVADEAVDVACGWLRDMCQAHWQIPVLHRANSV